MVWPSPLFFNSFFFKSLTRFKYLSVFSLSIIFTLWSTRTAKYSWWQFFSLSTFGLVVWMLFLLLLLLLLLTEILKYEFIIPCTLTKFHAVRLWSFDNYLSSVKLQVTEGVHIPIVYFLLQVCLCTLTTFIFWLVYFYTLVIYIYIYICVCVSVCMSLCLFGLGWVGFMAYEPL